MISPTAEVYPSSEGNEIPTFDFAAESAARGIEEELALAADLEMPSMG